MDVVMTHRSMVELGNIRDKCLEKDGEYAL